MREEISPEEECRRFRKALDAEGITPRTIGLFREIVYGHYRLRRRDLPWRRTKEPYSILVSEFMLQQTQVERVLAKYEEFLGVFPDFQSLAGASLSDVLARWQGLGYNRRAKALRETALRVVEEFGGRLPDSEEDLLSLPGVGRATAGAVTAFAFARPAVFLETNIRRVCLHFFFDGREEVRDKELAPVVEATLDAADPREWYYALMDFGAAMRNFTGNPNRRSAHYRKQSPFEGSDRQIRSMVLRELLREPLLTEKELVARVGAESRRGREVIRRLCREGFLVAKGGKLSVP